MGIEVLSNDDFTKWATDYSYERFLVTPKYEGIVCFLVYYDGKLTKAFIENEYNPSDNINIANTAKKIKNVPSKLKINKDSIIYGDYHYDGLYVPKTAVIKGIITVKKSAVKGKKKSVDKVISSILFSENLNDLSFKPLSMTVNDEEFTSKYLNERHKMLDVAELLGFDYCDYWRAIGGSTVIMVASEYKRRFVHKQPYKIDGCIVGFEIVNKISSYDNDNMKILKL